MQFNRARRLLSERTRYHGACLVSVDSSILSRAREHSYHFSLEGRSMGLSFHWRRGSSRRASKRRSCSSLLTSSQYLSNVIPPSMRYFSNTGHNSRARVYWSLVQNPMTCSTPRRLYQLRSKMTISPAAGKCWAYCWMYIWVFSRSEGAGSAMTRKTRGLTRSVRALIVPPLPAPSRPSNTMQTLRPLYLTHSWSFTSSTWSFFRAFSDFFLLSLSPSSLPAAFAMGASCRSRALTHDRLHEQLALFPVH